MNKKDTNKAKRVLYIYEALNRGEVINKKEQAEKFDVSEKTIQRDIKELKNYLASFYIYQNDYDIIFSREKGGYILTKTGKHYLTNKEVLGLSKILLESRAFNEKEMNLLLEKLIKQSSPEIRKKIEEIILNEKHHYVPVKHGKPLLERIWDLGQAVRKKKVAKIKYNKPAKSELIEREIEPLGIMFSQYYFYLIASTWGKDNDYKIVYRLDRIDDYEVNDNKQFNLKYTERFEEGKFRKRVQFMTAGSLLKIKFKFWGKSLEVILDKLPTARIIDESNGVYTLEAEVYGRGIKWWLLSLGEDIEVLEPKEFRDEMKSTIKKMWENYT